MRAPDRPIRAELFSTEHLEQFAGRLAAEQPRLSGQEARPAGCCRGCRRTPGSSCSPIRRSRTASRRARAISPAAEWLLNNFHIVEEQIREIHQDLPPGLLSGAAQARRRASSRAIPASTALAWAFVAHTDSRIELETLGRFVRAYQRVQPLTIGELWALAISLRLVLVENLRRLAESVAARGVARDRADAVADAQLAHERRTRSRIPAAMIQMLEQAAVHDGLRGPARPEAPRAGSRGHARAATGSTRASRAKARRPTRSSTPSTRRRWRRTRRCATSSRACGCCRPSTGRTSSRASASFTRRSARARASPRWTSPTRDRYRHAVEELSRGMPPRRGRGGAAGGARWRSRPRRRPSDGPSSQRLADPGYYLISKGRPRLEAALELPDSRPPMAAPRRGFAPPLPATSAPSRSGPLAILAVPLVSLRPARGASAAVAHPARARSPSCPRPISPARSCSGSSRSSSAPGASPSSSSPPACRRRRARSVAIPMLLTDEAEIRGGRRSGSRSTTSPIRIRELRFALLSDWSDAPSETHARRRGPPRGGARRDPGAQRAARTRGRGRRPLLGLPPPPPLERRRRRLDGLGAQARKARASSTASCAARRTRPSCLPERRAPRPPAVRYVITLDADTRLPREAARALGRHDRASAEPAASSTPRPAASSTGHAHPPAARDAHARRRPASARSSSSSSRARAASIPTPSPSPTSTRTSSARASTPARGSTTWTRSSARSTTASRRTRSCRTISSRGSSPAPGSSPTSSSSRVSPATTRWPRRASTAGCAATGSCCRGSSAAARGPARTLDGLRSPLIGRWKMLDNLRRSLSAPASFATLLAGWCLPRRRRRRLDALRPRGALASRPCSPSSRACCRSGAGVAKRSFLRGVVADLGIGLAQSGAARSSSSRTRHGCAPTRSRARSGGWP